MALSPRQQRTADERRERLLGAFRGLPETDVDAAGKGHHAFRVRKKAFAYHVVDHHGDGKIGLWVKTTRAEQGRLVGEDPERFCVPAYVGAQGWVGVRLDLDEVPWGAIASLVREAYLAQAPKALAAQVRARGARAAPGER